MSSADKCHVNCGEYKISIIRTIDVHDVYFRSGYYFIFLYSSDWANCLESLNCGCFCLVGYSVHFIHLFEERICLHFIFYILQLM